MIAHDIYEGKTDSVTTMVKINKIIRLTEINIFWKKSSWSISEALNPNITNLSYADTFFLRILSLCG